jgi:DNA-directed RNA polymerase specialized sigma24 family protein
MDDDPRDDAELVGVLAGDRDAFGRLLLRRQPSVWRLCRRLVGAGQDAEDVVQEAAINAFLGLGRLADPARFGACDRGQPGSDGTAPAALAGRP